MSRIQRLVRPGRQSPNWKLALPLLGLSAACLSVFAQSALPPVSSSSLLASSGSSAMHVDGSASSDRRTDFALVNPDKKHSMRFSGRYDDIGQVESLRERLGNDFLWFRRDGRSYVIQDAGVLAQAHAAWKPVDPVSTEMEALGSQMEAHGKVMEGLGARMESHANNGQPTAKEMEKLGVEMARLGEQMEPLARRLSKADSDAERERLSREMDALSVQMDQRSAQMDELSRQLERAHAPMQALSVQMDEASQPMQALGEKMDELGRRMEALSETANRTTLDLIDQALRDGKAVAVDSLATL